MKKIYFIFPIYFLACTLYTSAQITVTDELKQQLAAINTDSSKANSVETPTTTAEYFKQRISLFTNNSFKLSLVANISEPADDGAITQPIDKKEVVKVKAESKKLARDAKYFRQHISLFNGDTFQFNLVDNKVEKTIKIPETASAATTDPTAIITPAAPAVTESKQLARDAKFFRQHISLINGKAFQFSLEPNKPVRVARVKQASNLAAKYAYIIGVFEKAEAVEIPKSLIPSATDDELQAELSQRINANMADLKDQFALVLADSLRASIPQKMPANVTSLKQRVALLLNDTVRAGLYQTIANRYLVYDSISIMQTKQFFQESALEFTMKALHTYSKYGDQTGLRESYSGLAKVYKDQKKYSEAKWFVLQANAIAREQKDTKHIISSLVELASVKTAIKDYKLALGDLDEARQLATQNHLAKQESAVQANYAVVYAELNDPTKSAAALKRQKVIESNIRKAEIARMAANKTKDSIATVAAATKAKKKALAALKKAAADSTASAVALADIHPPKLEKSKSDSMVTAASPKIKKKAITAKKKEVRDTTSVAVSKIDLSGIDKGKPDSAVTTAQAKKKLLTATEKKAAKTPPAKKAVLL